MLSGHVGARQLCHRPPGQLRVVEDDQLVVAGPSDVELDHFRPELDRALEGGQGVLAHGRTPRAAMPDHDGPVLETVGDRLTIGRRLRIG
jgi:hypothetical protein